MLAALSLVGQVIGFVREQLHGGVSPQKVCEELCDKCFSPTTDGDGTGCDNETVLIVLLPGFVPPSGAASSKSDCMPPPWKDTTKL